MKWTLLIFRPTATSFSATTASPVSRSSVNDSVLTQSADHSEPEFEVDPQGFADLRDERRRVPPQVLHDGLSRLRLGPALHDDHFGVPDVLHIGLDRPFQELRAGLHACPAYQIINLREEFGMHSKRNRRLPGRPVLHVLHVLQTA